MIEPSLSMLGTVLAVLVLAGIVLVLGYAVLRTYKDGFGWLRTESGLSVACNLLLLLFTIYLAVGQQSSDRKFYAISRDVSTQLKQLHSGTSEYLEWRYAIVPNSTRDFDLRIVARKRENTNEFKAYDLRIIPVFIDTLTGHVDDADAVSGRLELELTSASVPPRRLNSREARIVVRNVMASLRTKYDGNSVSDKMRQSNRYRLFALRLRASYWHSYGGPRFSMEAYAWRVQMSVPPAGNPYPMVFQDKGWEGLP